MLLFGDFGDLPTDHDHAPIGEFYFPPTTTLIEYGGVLSPPAEGTPLGIAMDYLGANAASLGLLPGDVFDSSVVDLYQSQSNGVTHIYLQQEHNGLPVANALINVNVMPTGEILNVGSSFLPNLRDTGNPVPTITSDAALESLAEGLELTLTSLDVVTPNDPFDPSRQMVLSSGGISRNDIAAQLQYVPVPEGGVELAWQLNVELVERDSWYDASVSAVDGDVLLLNDWVAHASYNVLPIPVESPNFGTREIVVDPHDPTASPHGWHDVNNITGADFTITRGNNVHAYLDRNDDNTPDPNSSPDGGTALDFDFPLDLTLEPDGYEPAAVTNLFYMTNVLHDVLYQYGFDEVAGNFQQNNYGNGGLGNDYLFAEAQDGADFLFIRNNANMATPPDGMNPRMQMFLFNTATPERDGDLENGIIQHEFGHGVSNRLTGGPANASALQTIQSGGMGEGWSDFFSLMFTQEVGDTAFDSRGMGTYALNQAPNGPGVRSQVYSYDFNVNDHTYNDIRGTFSTHFAGETWATTLWDLNWALIDGKTIDSNLPDDGKGYDPNLYEGYNLGTGSGNQLAMQLVLDGMKLQPANPTFLDARDAILAADVALTGGMNQATIWEVFARRGMGFSADDAGDANSTNVTEATDLPPVSYIQGLKFYDANQNGVQDSGENGLEGWTIYLDLNDNGSLDTNEPSTVTNAIGEYNLTAAPGLYVVREVLKPNWVQTFPAGDMAQRITLPAGHEILPDIDFGNYAPPGQLSGIVWSDLNSNGVRDNNEEGLPGITVFIDEDGDGAFTLGERTEVTANNGSYRFTEVPVGRHTILQELPTGITQTFPTPPDGHTVTVDASQSISGLNFGNFYIPAQIAGFVWQDLNGDGVRDDGERGIANVRVYLDTNGDRQLALSERSVLTNSIGRYQFNVPPGDHSVRVAPMLGFAQSFPPDNEGYEITAVADDLLVGNSFGLRGFAADFGDAPFPYPTRFTNNGAAHEYVPGPVLGSVVSPDLNGQPSDGAVADDDDGVTILSTFEAGQTASFEINASVPGRVSAWIDFDRNGIWDPTAELVLNSQQVGSTATTFTINVPVTAVAGTSYARFRISSDQNLLPTGIASDGEVEDYAVTLVNNIPVPDDPLVTDPDPDDGSGGDPVTSNPYTNPANSYDVDNNGSVTITDAILIVADLIQHGIRELATPSGAVASFIDTNGDNRATLSDALEVVRELVNARNAGAGEGEAVGVVSDDKSASPIESKKQKSADLSDEGAADLVHDQALLAETAVATDDQATTVLPSDELEDSVALIADDLNSNELL